MSFLLKGWPATSGDGARSGKPPLAAKKLLLEVYGLSCLWGTRNMGTNISCKDSVDTTINDVDTMAQSKGRNVKKRSTSVDTSLGQVDTRVDTRDLSQGIDLPVWDSVSTHLMGRSTHSGISMT
ncbi:hypothetical protein Taro_035332 [Colocasia esculenta]|uniref:Uncharacterized protein n=1 Tax=Colocasia esculenta TaxID=4460 RepID=A0A843VU44_COLES|nr:hypothetical protein [Colocasia esculenta]